MKNKRQIYQGVRTICKKHGCGYVMKAARDIMFFEDKLHELENIEQTIDYLFDKNAGFETPRVLYRRLQTLRTKLCDMSSLLNE